MNGDNILDEGATEIVEKINASMDSVESNELSYKTKLYITIVVGVIISFCGIYTLYFVFLAPDIVTDEETTVLDSSIFSEAVELVKYVPYSLGEDLVYENYDVTELDSLSDDFILAFLINNLPSSSYMNILDCEDGKVCLEVTTSTLNTLANTYYGLTFSLPDEINYDENGVCTLSSGIYSCSSDLTSSFSGKISEVEQVSVDEDYLIIYETVLFVNNGFITEDNGSYTLTFDSVSVSPIDGGIIEENGDYLVTSDSLDTEFINIFYSRLNTYVHTYSVTDDGYIYESTTIKTS